MPMSRAQKQVMRGQKSPKSGSNATGDGMKGAKKAGKQDKAKSSGDSMKLII